MRQTFGVDLGASPRTGVGAMKRRMAEKEAALRAGTELPKRWQGQLTPELVEAFVMKYLHYKYDNPLPTPQFHREIWAACTDTSLPFVLSLAPRGHAKSTAITEAYGMAALCFRVRDFALVLSNTFTQSAEFLADMLLEFEENEDLRRDFEVYKILRGSEDNIEVKFKDGYKIRVVAKGAEQKVRGVKWNKRRPNLVLFDDLEDDEQVESPERRKKFQNWFMRAVLPFGSDDVLFRGAATILHFDSLAQNLSKDIWDKDTNLEGWYTLRYRAHQAFDDFSNILWPEKFPEARLRAIRQKYLRAGDKDGYSQEYLNIPIAEGEGLIRAEDLIPMQPIDFDRLFKTYATWDFALEKKQTSDYTVGAVWGIDEKGGCYLLDIRRGRWNTMETMDEMFKVQKDYDCVCQFAEGGQIEKAIGPFIYDRMRQKNTYFVIEPMNPTKDKVARNASFRGATRAKGVKFNTNAPWWPAFEEELTRFPKGEHDDQVDACSMIGLKLHSLIPALTPDEAANEEFIINFGRDIRRQAGRSTTTGY